MMNMQNLKPSCPKYRGIRGMCRSKWLRFGYRVQLIEINNKRRYYGKKAD